MNNVDYLLRVQFSTFSLEEKLEIKRLGPHRPDDLILLQPGQNATRTFKTEWYDRKTWLTASTSKRALFCFPCLLFGIGTNADSVRTTGGFKDLKHLAERTVKHESCKPHNQLRPAIGTIGARAYQRNILEHNKQTEENRYVLGRLISCKKPCGKCELGLRGHDESADRQSDRERV